MYVNAPPVDGKANAAVIATLAEQFKVSKSKVRVVSGHGGRSKLVEVKE